MQSSRSASTLNIPSYSPLQTNCNDSSRPGPACTRADTFSTGLATPATARTATMRAVWQFIACLIQVRRRRRLYRPGSSPAAAGRAPSPPLALCRRLQVTLAAIAIAVIRTRVMVDVYIGYYCAFELNNAQMCTPTIGVAATSIVLSGLVLILIAVRPRGRGSGGGQPSLRYSGCSSASLHHVNTPPSLPAPILHSLKHPPTPLPRTQLASNEASSPLACIIQVAGGLMWFGFGIAAAIGVSERDNPLDDYLEALSGARGVVAIRCACSVGFKWGKGPRGRSLEASWWEGPACLCMCLCLPCLPLKQPTARPSTAAPLHMPAIPASNAPPPPPPPPLPWAASLPALPCSWACAPRPLVTTITMVNEPRSR